MRTSTLLVSAIVAALGLGGCSTGRSDRDPASHAGITTRVSASAETTQASGIASWAVIVLDDGAAEVQGIGADGLPIRRLRFATLDDYIRVEIVAPDEGFIELDDSGATIHDELGDASTLALFHDDAEAQLQQQGFRNGMACASQVAAAAVTCAQAWQTKAPMQIVACLSQTAAAAQACTQGGGTSGGGTSGGGSSGDSASGSESNDDSKDPGETVGEDGMDSAADDAEGDDGSQSDSGNTYASSGASDAGDTYASSGSYPGGTSYPGEDDGYPPSDDGGYPPGDDGGYPPGDGGYPYDAPAHPGAAPRLAIPGVDTIELGFTQRTTPSSLDTRVWNMSRHRRGARR